ncbi:MAG: DUF4962 domain-containing protein [bacterium]
MKKKLFIFICFAIIPTLVLAKSSWKPVSPETAVIQSESGWKAVKSAKKEYDQLVIQKKLELEIKDKTSFTFRYRVRSDREILYIQFALLAQKNKVYFVILHRPTPNEWHQLTLTRDDFRTFDYIILAPKVEIKAIEFSFHTRGQLNSGMELETSEVLVDKKPKVGAENLPSIAADQVSFLWPKNGEIANANPPFFNWQQIPGVNAYTVQYSQNSMFTSVTEDSVSQTYFTPGILLDSGRWYARLQYQKNNQVGYTPPISFLINDKSRAFMPFKLPEKLNRPHPYLYLTPELLKRYRIEKETIKKEGWNAIDTYVHTNSTDFIPQEPEPYPNGIWNYDYWKIMGDRSGAAQNHIILSAFDYLLSGDTASAAIAKRIMLAVSKWDVNGSTSVRSCDHAAQALLYSLSLGYDWLYDYLTPAERQQIRDCIINRATQMASFLNPLNADPTNNHPWFCASALGIGGLAVYNEVPAAKSWVDYTQQLYCGAFLCLGGQDGDWHEGISYWSYTLFFVFQWLDCLESATGLDLYAYPWLQQTARYKIYAHPPLGFGVPFGDSQIRPPSEFDALIMLRLASRYQDNLAQWYAKEVIKSPVKNWLVYNYLWDDPGLPTTALSNKPTTAVFRDSGIAIYHSDITSPDETMLALKSGPYLGRRAGHAHPDQNSFILYGLGDPLLIDSGYYDVGKGNYYGSPHHLGWTIQTKAHNTLLADGYGQTIYTPGADGKLNRYLSLGDMAYFEGDASSPEIYQGRISRYIRNIFALDKNLYLVYDNLDSRQPVRYDWLFHSIYPFSVDKDRKLVEVVGKKAKLDIQFLNPEPLGYTLSSGFTPVPERKDPNSFPDQYHVSVYPRLDTKLDSIDISQFGVPEYIATQPSTKKQMMSGLIALYVSPAINTSVMNITPMSTGDWFGGTIQVSKQVYHYLLSRDTGSNTLGYQGYSFTGRGAIIGMGTTGNINRLILLDGQQVKMFGMSMFQASTPVTMLAAIDKNQAEIQFAVEKDAKIEIPPLGEPKEIYIDGILQKAGKLSKSRISDWNYHPDTGKLIFTLPAGTHTVAVTYQPNEDEFLKLPSKN